jgi:hypothetical protein
LKLQIVGVRENAPMSIVQAFRLATQSTERDLHWTFCDGVVSFEVTSQIAEIAGRVASRRQIVSTEPLWYEASRWP